MREPGARLRLHAPLGGRPAARGAGPPRVGVRTADPRLHQGRQDRADGGDGAAAGERDGGDAAGRQDEQGEVPD